MMIRRYLTALFLSGCLLPPDRQGLLPQALDAAPSVDASTTVDAAPSVDAAPDAMPSADAESRLDAEALADASPRSPDAATPRLDAEPAPPDAAPPRPDAAPPRLDAEVALPDAAPPRPDAAPPTPCDDVGGEPQDEVCNGVDDDCDGVRDDEVTCDVAGERCVEGRCQTPQPLFDDFVRIEPGFVEMGSSLADRNFFDSADEVQHLVGLTRAFAVSPTEVTQADYNRVIGARPSQHLNCDNCPVERVSWLEAVAYCNALTGRSYVPLSPCYTAAGQRLPGACTGYRLPTEAEWEFAARAGTDTVFASGGLLALGCEPDANLSRVGWYCGNAARLGQAPESQPVRGLDPNAWGLYDMHGNVAEWVEDRYAADYGGIGEVVLDPTGPAGGVTRVVRGGDFQSPSQDARSAARSNTPPASRLPTLGFRCVRTLASPGVQ